MNSKHKEKETKQPLTKNHYFLFGKVVSSSEKSLPPMDILLKKIISYVRNSTDFFIPHCVDTQTCASIIHETSHLMYTQGTTHSLYFQSYGDTQWVTTCLQAIKKSINYDYYQHQVFTIDNDHCRLYSGDTSCLFPKNIIYNLEKTYISHYTLFHIMNTQKT